MSLNSRKGGLVIGTFIDALDWSEAIKKILYWGNAHQSRSVCLCNVHSAVTATNNKELTQALSKSDMVLPDGAPIAWVLRKKGFSNQTRIAGPDLMDRLCSELATTDIGIFLFGSSENTLDKLTQSLIKKYPTLNISGVLSPKYGNWSKKDEEFYIQTINSSGAGIVFVGLGCPKQEIWMTNNCTSINSVLLGVGAAFDFHAGIVKRAPLILQKMGLEWLHRLFSEPKRLWKRYLVTNSIFMLKVTNDFRKTN